MSELLSITLITAISFFVSLCFSCLLTQPKLRAALDHPNSRSLHTIPTPRTGGLAILAGLLSGGLIYAWTSDGDLTVPLLLAASVAAIAAISLWDDLRQIPVSIRVSVHAGSALGLLLSVSMSIHVLKLPWGQYSLPALAGGLFSILFIIWFTNLYNFMDGIDGLAAGMGVFGFAAFGIIGLLGSVPVFTAYSFIIAGACAGFLCINLPSGRLFMGDVGSSVLGFLAAGFALWADHEKIFHLWVGILIFSPFIVDATVTLFRRIMKREKFWQAHRSHFYQRLVLLGWSHRKTTLSAYGMMVGCGISALVAVVTSSIVQIGIIIGWTLIYFMLMVVITRMEFTNRMVKESNETGTLA